MASTRGEVDAPSLRRPVLLRLRTGLGRVSVPAWGAIALVVAFIAVTAWWLSVDQSLPYNDAAQHLIFAFGFRDRLSEGRLLEAIDFSSFYPPATYLLGAFATFVGGVNVATPILAQNVVYVPLLALACYRMARMLAGPTAGLLAVVFALGAPLVIEQFHVFMLDVPQMALVAVTAWLILASDRFARVGVAALAGLALGVAVASKELAPVYLVGLVVCVLARDGGWRNWRGLVAFGAVALAVGAPWYIRQITLGDGAGILRAAGAGGDVPPAARPALLSGTNLAWYFWATLNGLLLAPLFAIAAVGVGAAVARVGRLRRRDDLTLELLCGLGGAWLALTVMPHHDVRYTLSLIAFIAVLGTVWIVRLPRAPRAVAISLLVGAIVVAHVGATLGVGGETTRRLPGNRKAAYGEGVPPRNRVIVYSNHDYMVSGPHRHPDLLALLQTLRRGGISTIQWDDMINRWDPYLEGLGLYALARVANLGMTPQPSMTPGLNAGEASLIRAHTLSGYGDPCMRFIDGSGLWVRVSLPGQGLQTYCPRQVL